MAGMSKRHFEGLTGIIRKEVEGINRIAIMEGYEDEPALRLDTVESLAGAIATLCAKENPSFNRARLLRDCGLSSSQSEEAD